MANGLANDPAMQEFIENRDGELKVVAKRVNYSYIDLREPFEFEDDLIEDLVTNTGDNFGASVPVKGKWVHGWLREQEEGEDYINSIYRNWLFFTTYVKARTKQFINTSEYSIRQGSYKSMHRYISMLEDLDLVQRTRLENVDPSDYDHFVPERMRNRRFVEITTPLEEDREKWTRPNASLYGEDGGTEGQDGEQQDQPIPATDTPTPDEETQDSTDNVSFQEYPRLDEFEEKIQSVFFDLTEEALSQTNLDLDAAPSDFALDEFIVYGVWAAGEAEAGVDTLNCIISIDTSFAENKVGFLPETLASEFTRYISTEFEDWFPVVSAVATYDDELDDTIDIVGESIEGDRDFYFLLEDRVRTLQ